MREIEQGSKARTLETLLKWQKGLRISHMAHHRAAARCSAMGRLLGISVVVLSTAVGTSIFATLERSPSTRAKMLAGLLSVTAAILAALQTFLGFARREAGHHEVAVRYGALRREIEAVLALPPAELELQQTLADLRGRWDGIDVSAPAVPPRIWQGAVRTIDGTGVSSKSSTNGADLLDNSAEGRLAS